MSYQTCTKCKACKPIERFYYIARSQRHDTRCKECVLAYLKERRETIPGVAEHEAEISAKSYRKRKGADPSLGTWATKTAKQKAQAYAALKRWRKANREAFRTEARLSIKLRRSPVYLAVWPVILHHYGNKCLSCGSTDRLCFDHVKPLALGGHNLVTNGQPLCRKCNTFKGHADRERDCRPDKGAWLAELAKLNPWIAEPMQDGWWHLTAEGRKRAKLLREKAQQRLVMPGQIAHEESESAGFRRDIPLDARQNAQKRLIDTLLTALPLETKQN